MRRLIAVAFTAVVMVLAGCATQQQMPINLERGAVGAGAGRIGVVMTSLPQRDTITPGASCLLCLAFATQSNAAITEHAKRLDTEELAELKNEFAAALRKSGSDVIVIDDPIDPSKLPDHPGSGSNVAPKSYAAFKQRYQIDRLLVLNITHLGFVRTYSSYIPTSDPKGAFKAVGYLVNLATNSYDWYLPVEINQGTSEKWDDPPRYPGLTNAYYQAIEIGKDSLLKAIATSPAGGRPQAAASPAATPASSLKASTPAAPTSIAAAPLPATPKLVRMQLNTGRKPQIGDEWEYIASDSIFGKQKKLLWRVTKVDIAGVVEQLSIDGVSAQDWTFTGQADLIGAPIEMGFLFGQHWDAQNRIPELKVRGELGDCARSLQCTIDGRVTGKERITIAAGTFDAIRIDGELVYKQFAIPPRGSVSVWYSEKDRRLLKQVARMRSSFRTFDETVELQVARAYQ